jgi:hypothetical protein
MISNLITLTVVGIYIYNVYLQYKELSSYGKFRRWSLALLLPPFNLLKFLITWVEKKT